MAKFNKASIQLQKFPHLCFAINIIETLYMQLRASCYLYFLTENLTQNIYNGKFF